MTVKLVIMGIALIIVFILLQGFVNSHCIGGHYYGSRANTYCQSVPTIQPTPTPYGDV